jgi:RNA polymerase sigma-70 factor (ECF subfamily)
VEEKALIESYKSGNDHAFAILIRQNQPYIEAAILRVVGSREPLSDVMQEVLIRISKGLRTFKGDSKLSSWMFRIGLNEGYRYIQSRKRSAPDIQLDDVAEISCPELTIDSLLMNRQRGEVLRECVEELPEDYSSVFKSFYFEELRLDEISNKYNLPQGTVNSRIARARNMIREKYRKRHK